MPTYSFTVTAEQDAALQGLATANGYPSARAFIDTKVAEILNREVVALDAALVARAQAGQPLTDAEKARVRAKLGL